MPNQLYTVQLLQLKLEINEALCQYSPIYPIPPQFCLDYRGTSTVKRIGLPLSQDSEEPEMAEKWSVVPAQWMSLSD